MDSSRDGVVKKLNGHGAGAAESGRPFEPPKAQSPALVDELAEAMKMARESLERPQPPIIRSAPESPLPAMAPPRSLFDDEEDDAAMPIPSTWRSPPEPPKQRMLGDQMRAAVFGFTTGLAIVVPVVLVLTGRIEGISLDALFEPGETATQQAAPAATVTPQVQQRVVSTTVVTPQKPAAALAGIEPAVAKFEPAPPPEVSWASAIAEGKKRILAGDITGGREILGPAVAADEPEATMALAETFDPNMLAAWGVRDVAADVPMARELYQKALAAGVHSARTRLQGLN